MNKQTNKINLTILFACCIVFVLMLSSCSVTQLPILNVNSNNTTVTLSRKNFRILDHVQGQSSATYVFGIGGMSTKSLYNNARAAMYQSANLSGTNATTIANETVEVQNTAILFPFFFRKTVIVGGNILEFVDGFTDGPKASTGSPFGGNARPAVSAAPVRPAYTPTNKVAPTKQSKAAPTTVTQDDNSTNTDNDVNASDNADNKTTTKKKKK